MNKFHLESELNGFWGDIKATEDKLTYDRENYARMLKNGLGDDIKTYLENPPKPSKWKTLKNKIKRWWYS
jgi:hypothetical protein